MEKKDREDVEMWRGPHRQRAQVEAAQRGWMDGIFPAERCEERESGANLVGGEGGWSEPCRQREGHMQCREVMRDDGGNLIDREGGQN